MIARIVRRASEQRGISLVEMLVSIAVLGIFFAAFATVVGSAIRSSGEVQQQAVIQTEVRAAVDSLVADLRQATIAGDTSLARVSTATGTQLTFLSPDRTQPMRLRQISYRVSGDELQRALATSTNTAAPWSIPALGAWTRLASPVITTATPVFTYFDAAGASTSVAANVRTVRIRVVLATASSPTRQLVYDTRVTLRPSA